jgi:hypothetical protein
MPHQQCTKHTGHSLSVLVLELSPVGISQGADGFFKVPVCWSNVCHHHSFGVATQAVLQKARQLGVPGVHTASNTAEGIVMHHLPTHRDP